jgi:SNF2 family DNA or RNA helicase
MLYKKNKTYIIHYHTIPVFKNSKRCILISGTPLLARPDEAFNMLTILRPDIFTDFKEYANRYCNPLKSKFGKKYSGASCTAELNCILNNGLMIRRLKSDVLNQLPAK